MYQVVDGQSNVDRELQIEQQKCEADPYHLSPSNDSTH